MAIGSSSGNYYEDAFDMHAAVGLPSKETLREGDPMYKPNRIDNQAFPGRVIPGPTPDPAAGRKKYMDWMQDKDQFENRMFLHDPFYVPTPEIPTRVQPGTKEWGSGWIISKNGNPDIHVIRHGSTDMNSDEKVRSWSNVPLNEEGKKESREVADSLKGSGLQVIYHSDLDRAADTAKDIKGTTGAELVAMPEFRSWHAGDLTGKHYSEANPTMEDHAHDMPNKPLPGGESFNEFRDRVFNGLDKATKDAGDRSMGIVTHRGVERLLAAWHANGQPASREVHLPTFFDDGAETGTHQILNLHPTPTQVGEFPGTGLGGDLGKENTDYMNWAQKNFPKTDPEDLEEDYDMKGFWKDHPDFQVKPGAHFPDTYKLPNHPTFSDESRAHGKTYNDMHYDDKEGDENVTYEGGHWEKDGNHWNFTPGKTNLEYHTAQELIEYFKKFEPGNKLILPGQ